MALLNAYAVEAFSPDGPLSSLEDQDTFATDWAQQERRFLARAPSRLDVLAPYLNWLIAHRQIAALNDMVIFAKTIDADHPVVLWFDGVVHLESSDPDIRQTGLAQLRRSLDQGLERFMPVDPSVKNALTAGGPS